MIEFPAIINPTPTIIQNLQSNYVNQDYKLFISLPVSYHTTEQTYPVFYVLDGNACYIIARLLVEMQQVMENIPEIIIVGIGYPVETYLDTVSLRGRDFTVIELTEEQKSGGYPFDETGGAANFYSVLSREIIPMIDSEFRTNPDNRVLAGFSLSGTFALYALFQEPHLFQSIIALSPGVDAVRDVEARYATTHTSLPVSLYIGVEHTATSHDSWVNGIKSFLALVDERQYTGHKNNLRVFEGVDHAQAGMIGFTYAIKDVYAK